MSENTVPLAATRNPRGLLFRFLALGVLVFAAVALFMFLLARIATVPSPAAPASMAGGGEAGLGTYPTPDFRFASLDGGQMSPRDFLGEVVLIDIWASWCGPCRLQAKMIEQIHAEFAARGVRFLAVNVGEDEATVRAYVADHPFPYPVLLDSADTLSRRYQILGLPTLMIVNPQGEIQFLHTGVVDVPTLRQKLLAAGAAAA